MATRSMTTSSTNWADVERLRLPSEVVLEELEAAYEIAQQRCGTISRRFCIAGRPVLLEFAGAALASKLTLALEHLAASHHEAALVVRIWDGRTTEATPRLPRRPSPGLGLQRLVAGAGSIRRFYSEPSHALYCFDTSRRCAWVWFETDELPAWDIGAPLRPAFAWWAESVGAQLAHGAVVGTSEGAALLAGKGGSGKSTTALSCVRAGLDFAGDDYVIVDDAAPGVAHSLYSSATVSHREIEQRFPELGAHVVRAASAGDKRVLSVYAAARDRVAVRLPIRAVVAQSVSPTGDASLRAASAIEGLAALAPSSLLQLAGSQREGFERLARTVRLSKTYAFRAGRSTERNVELVRLMLAESAA
jgi:hypothetical protein